MLIPSSHFAVDESAIKFHGCQRNTYLLANKPAKEGFVFYALASYGGIIHDFIVSSSQEGVNEVGKGIKVNLPTRSVRQRKKGHSGARSDDINLLATKAVVHQLADQVTAQ